MKRVGHLIDKIADIENLYEAFYQACRGKQRKKEVLLFRQNFDENIAMLHDQILSGNVRVGNYHYFTIHDPKERVICAADFNERVLHHAIINVCMPYFDRSLIETTYATRKGKGVYAAIDKAISAFAKYQYSLKLDFRKYYDSIDHKILKSLLRSKFKDNTLLQIFDKIIDSYSVSSGKGLPIGNLTSQYFANAYLSPLDHCVKEQLKAPIYIRYMDDILITCNDKSQLKDIYVSLNKYADEELNISLKPPIFRETRDGQIFLGYKIKPYRCELSGRSKKRYRQKLIDYNNKLESGEWNDQTYHEHILPLTAFVRHAVSKKFRQSCVEIITRVES